MELPWLRSPLLPTCDFYSHTDSRPFPPRVLFGYLFPPPEPPLGGLHELQVGTISSPTHHTPLLIHCPPHTPSWGPVLSPPDDISDPPRIQCTRVHVATDMRHSDPLDSPVSSVGVPGRSAASLLTRPAVRGLTCAGFAEAPAPPSIAVSRGPSAGPASTLRTRANTDQRCFILFVFP